jgi:hypothetical protein
MLNRLRLLVGEKLCGTKSVFSAFFNWYSGQQLPFKIKSPRLFVRQGKGGKDRVVYLNNYIRDRLAAFTGAEMPVITSLVWLPSQSHSKSVAGHTRRVYSIRTACGISLPLIFWTVGATFGQCSSFRDTRVSTVEIYLAVTNDSRTIWTFMPATSKPSLSCHVI